MDAVGGEAHLIFAVNRRDIAYQDLIILSDQGNVAVAQAFDVADPSDMAWVAVHQAVEDRDI